MAIVASLVALLALSVQLRLSKAEPVEVVLNVTAVTGGQVESDWTALFYGDSPLLLGNNGGPDRGGFSIYDLVDEGLPEIASVYTGRTKLLTTVYGIDDKDYLVTIAQPSSLIRAFELPSLQEAEGLSYKQLGDWSALCAWKSKTGNQYLYLSGKKQAVQYLVRSREDNLELVQVQMFDLPWEVSGCAASSSLSKLLLSLDDMETIYSIPLAESTGTPEISTFGKAGDAITSLGIYVADNTDYILVSYESSIAVYSQEFELLGTLAISGIEDIEIQGLSVYQAANPSYPEGAIVFAGEGDDFLGFGAASLAGALTDLGIEPDTAYDPRKLRSCPKKSPICGECGSNGYCRDDEGGTTCECFAGFAGEKCGETTCTADCSGHGQCIGPNICSCDAGWGGLHCSFILVEPVTETDENGGDGDDPAIWVSPVSPELSLVITTVKSEEGAGLGVFDLAGHLVYHFEAGEPNNVDMIYGFQAGNRTIDLAFAACRADDTLCLFEMQPNGTLVDIAGGIQPVEEDYEVYGSCVYRSPTTGKQYLFVNEKSARYLQYELTSTADGTLETTLVRDFVGGSGGQVEGCVTDEENGWLFLGEEPSALWRYPAEPDSTEERFLVAQVGDGEIHGDVEGVTIVLGKTREEGFVLVSCQGVSGYNIYRRAEPHEFIGTFTLSDSADGQIDHVTNTDGITAIGRSLGPAFPLGLFVTHDDANERPDGSTSSLASFKFARLEDILGADAIKELGLMEEVDADWDPRAFLR
ncbi:hypothetical protein B0I35DRAFT_452443 [Stachybotrys elegans]|uniref:3-phytase n=1 Tax=Stachybotrys elegans TaxID=80388 RepID=A0A8K0WNJ9_9HYPO|nr:hypothetical protein B0I35DRAFT_452443 [Stachybotrys elegans]